MEGISLPVPMECASQITGFVTVSMTVETTVMSCSAVSIVIMPLLSRFTFTLLFKAVDIETLYSEEELRLL